MIRTFPFYFELCLRRMNFHPFPPFWHHVRNVSKCDKLVTITLFGIYLVNKMIKYDESRWICLRTVDFYISDAWKSIFRGKNENIQKVYSIGLWICLPWDFCASSWDHETWEVCSWMGEGCPMFWQIYARHCIVMKIVYESTRIKNKKYNEKLNKPMHKFGGVLDKYGGWGWGGMYVPSLNFIIVHFPFWRVVHVPLPGWYLPILQIHLALCCFSKAMLLKNV